MMRLHFWMYPFFQGSIDESDYKKSKNINTYPKIVRNGIKQANERYDLREFERVIPHIFDNIHIIYFIYIILQHCTGIPLLKILVVKLFSSYII